jgi:integrase
MQKPLLVQGRPVGAIYFAFARVPVFSRSRLRAESPCRARGRRSPSNELLLAGTKLSGRARVAVAITAFTGLRKSEVRGLQWPDYTGDFLHVRRGVWRTTVGDTKTKESKNAVPVIGPLRRILDEHRRTTANGNGWILAGEKKGFALNLDNLCRREIQPVIREKWHGWQRIPSGAFHQPLRAGRTGRGITDHSSACQRGNNKGVLP